MPERSKCAVSHRYAKLCFLIYRAHGIEIDEKGALAIPPEFNDGVAEFDETQLEKIGLVSVPAKYNVNRWSFEEDIALLRAVPILGRQWAEISSKIIPHRSRGHLRKRYQVLERRVAATVRREKKGEHPNIKNKNVSCRQRKHLTVNGLGSSKASTPDAKVKRVSTVGVSPRSPFVDQIPYVSQPYHVRQSYSPLSPYRHPRGHYHEHPHYLQQPYPPIWNIAPHYDNSYRPQSDRDSAFEDEYEQVSHRFNLDDDKEELIDESRLFCQEEVDPLATNGSAVILSEASILAVDAILQSSRGSALVDTLEDKTTKIDSPRSRQESGRHLQQEDSITPSRKRHRGETSQQDSSMYSPPDFNSNMGFYPGDPSRLGVERILQETEELSRFTHRGYEGDSRLWTELGSYGGIDTIDPDFNSETGYSRPGDSVYKNSCYRSMNENSLQGNRCHPQRMPPEDSPSRTGILANVLARANYQGSKDKFRKAGSLDGKDKFEEKKYNVGKHRHIDEADCSGQTDKRGFKEDMAMHVSGRWVLFAGHIFKLLSHVS